MLHAISSLFSTLSQERNQEEARKLYFKVVESARNPEFYIDYFVPDTLDGRFDMITLHLFIEIIRLKKQGSNESLEILRALTEIFFADMDRSLREMGASDTGIGKKIKKISQAFYGRLLAYQSASNNKSALQSAILRNLYRSDENQIKSAQKMTDYVLEKIMLSDNVQRC